MSKITKNVLWLFLVWMTNPRTTDLTSGETTCSPHQPQPETHESTWMRMWITSQHLHVQSQNWQHEINVYMLEANNKDTRTKWAMSFWCVYWWLLTDLTHCFGVSITDVDQVNASWVTILSCMLKNPKRSP